MEWDDYKRLAANSSGQNCPVRKTLNLMQGKWTLYVIFELSKAEVLRFGELKKKLPGITNTMLISTLRFLEEHKLVTRVQYNEIPPHVEYSLSEAGKALYPVFVEMGNWGNNYLAESQAVRSCSSSGVSPHRYGGISPMFRRSFQ